LAILNYNIPVLVGDNTNKGGILSVHLFAIMYTAEKSVEVILSLNAGCFSSNVCIMFMYLGSFGLSLIAGIGKAFNLTL